MSTSYRSLLCQNVTLSELHIAAVCYLSAYCQCHSTETALLHVTNCLLGNTDQGQVSILTLLDLSAVFDTIEHGHTANAPQHHL